MRRPCAFRVSSSLWRQAGVRYWEYEIIRRSAVLGNPPCQRSGEAVAMLLNAGVCGANGDIFAVAREVERFSILDLALYSIESLGQARLYRI